MIFFPFMSNFVYFLIHFVLCTMTASQASQELQRLLSLSSEGSGYTTLFSWEKEVNPPILLAEAIDCLPCKAHNTGSGTVQHVSSRALNACLDGARAAKEGGQHYHGG